MRSKSGSISQSAAAIDDASELPSCGVKQKPDDLAVAVDGERRGGHDGLREDAAVVAVVAAEGEDLVGGPLLGQRDPAVGAELLERPSRGSSGG